MNQQPVKVSVVITTYKREARMVERAAKSVLNQTYKNIELIIVDDSPRDYELRNEVKEMAEALGERVRYIQHEENKGACAARNTGIKASNGEFIGFLDDDDEWLAEKIKKQLEKFEDKDTALVYCGNYVIDIQNNTQRIFNTKYFKGMVFDDLIYENFVGSTSYPLIRKDVLEKLGGFDEKMGAAQDHEMWLRISKKYKIDYVKEPLVNYYIHAGEQITKNHRGRADAYLRLVDINADYLSKHKKAYAILLFNAIFETIYFDIKQGRRLFYKVFRIYPFFIMRNLAAIKWLYIMPLIKR